MATSEDISWDGSDHTPIFLRLREPQKRLSSINVRVPRFFDLRPDGLIMRSLMIVFAIFGTTLREGIWGIGVKLWRLKQIRQLHRTAYMASQQREGNLLKRLKQIRQLLSTRATVIEFRRVKQELRDLRKHQETAAWQRCRPFVLRDGDKNTSYFHTKASNRRRRNKLTGLEDAHGTLHKKSEGMMAVVLDYFLHLFSRSRPEITMDDVDFVGRRLTDDMVSMLSRPYSRDEIEIALAEMHPCKSPGPDGFPALFYKRYWDKIGDDICGVVLDFLEHGHMPVGVNYTYVVLIPKTKKPTKMTDLRPISLCNVSYKIISKVLANRLKSILPDIIDDNQSAFVPGRLITDNILLSSKVFNSMRLNHAKKRGVMALKLDMSKAYDRLACVMIKMGFPAIWIDRVMTCVTSVTYSFLVNGVASEVLVLERGLRQGDPISPYLFLLCAEGLGNLIKKAHAERLICGVSISCRAPLISHLFFADDSIVFARANVQEANVILGILKTYEALSVQMVNFHKSEVSFNGVLVLILGAESVRF